MTLDARYKLDEDGGIRIVIAAWSPPVARRID
jgi:hypothetical protein